MFYGIGGARISAQDGATIRLDARGNVFVSTGATEQGQGMETIAAQVAATAMGVPIERVRVISGDTEHTPYGGGTWASRAAGIGGEAIAQSGKGAAGADPRRGRRHAAGRGGEPRHPRTESWSTARPGAERIGLDEIGRICYFRPDTLPQDFQAELVATRHYVPKDYPFAFTNGVQGAYVEIDAETGFLRLLNHWCVEDCGTVINPQMVDEQIRGGIVQGLGGALWEHCVYDEAGQLLNGTMADYLVPQSNELCDIECDHVVSMTGSSELGAKGAGEAGTCGAPAVVMNAINDALSPFRHEGHRDALHARPDPRRDRRRAGVSGGAAAYRRARPGGSRRNRHALSKSMAHIAMPVPSLGGGGGVTGPD